MGGVSIKHILIPTDGSPVANEAAKAAIALARQDTGGGVPLNCGWRGCKNIKGVLPSSFHLRL